MIQRQDSGRAPNDESRLQSAPESSEQPSMDEFVADGLSDEENVMTDERVDLRSLGNGNAVPMERHAHHDVIAEMVDEIYMMLASKDDTARLDIYAWSDGTVSNGEDPPEESAFMVSLFSPDDELSRDDIREMIEEGFEAIPGGSGTAAPDRSTS